MTRHDALSNVNPLMRGRDLESASAPNGAAKASIPEPDQTELPGRPVCDPKGSPVNDFFILAVLPPYPGLAGVGDGVGLGAGGGAGMSAFANRGSKSSRMAN